MEVVIAISVKRDMAMDTMITRVMDMDMMTTRAMDIRGDWIPQNGCFFGKLPNGL